MPAVPRRAGERLRVRCRPFLAAPGSGLGGRLAPGPAPGAGVSASIGCHHAGCVLAGHRPRGAALRHPLRRRGAGGGRGGAGAARPALPGGPRVVAGGDRRRAGAWGLDAVWPVERIVRDNVEFRTFPDFKDLYAPFDDLLFFGDNGGGDHFGFVPGDPSRGVVVWDHETDERRTVADGLADYLTRVLPSGGDEWYHPSA
ncbi:hypothetical protein Asp14428_05140 [Actinoplanes sp. NBRC 14428]|nr:hypothetical protein Asp14428_05140 [Actinoplanes sp. NBRC 14428]